MTEKELISKLQELKRIEPQKDWVFLTKNSILSQKPELIKEENSSALSIFKWLVFSRKPVLVSLVILGLFISTFSFAQNALPGDFFYSLKIAAEKGQALFVSEKEKPKFILGLNEKRLEELDKVVKAGQAEKLSPAISAFEESANKAAKEVSKVIKEEGGEAAVKSIEKYVQGKDKTKEVFNSLGLEPKMSQEDEKLYAEFLVKDWEKRTLNENQEKLLKEAKEFFEKGDYSSALYTLIMKNSGEDSRLQTNPREENEIKNQEIPQVKLDVKNVITGEAFEKEIEAKTPQIKTFQSFYNLR